MVDLTPPHEVGGAIPGLDAPAYRLWASPEPSVPVLISVPHAGRSYPDDILTALRAPQQTSVRLEDRFVDSLAGMLAVATGASLLIADAPRAMIDLNRSVEDIDWEMIAGSRLRPTRNSLLNRRARNGLGLIPRRIPGFGELWRKPLAREELDRRIDMVYQPYHRALGQELERLRDRWGCALLVDLHSMPPLRPAHVQDKPAEFVIGDRFGASSDPAISDLALRYLGAHGRRAAHNRPYSGGYVLDRYGHPTRSVQAIQVEICRSTYLDNKLDLPSPRMAAIARLLSGLVREMASEVVTSGSGSRFDLAAE